jgi:hypothetical protein
MAKLTDADKKALVKLQADATRRTLFVVQQAERIARPVVPGATQRLLSRIVAIGDEDAIQRGVYAAVSEEKRRLTAEFRLAGLSIRELARKIALGQVEVEAKQLQADLTAMAGRDYPLPAVFAAVDTRAGDEHWADHAAAAVAQRWASLVLAQFTAWKRTQGKLGDLHKRIGGVSKSAEPSWRGQAKNAALYAYQDEHRGAWRSLKERDPRSGFKP